MADKIVKDKDFYEALSASLGWELDRLREQVAHELKNNKKLSDRLAEYDAADNDKIDRAYYEKMEDFYEERIKNQSGLISKLQARIEELENAAADRELDTPEAYAPTSDSINAHKAAGLSVPVEEPKEPEERIRCAEHELNAQEPKEPPTPNFRELEGILKPDAPLGDPDLAREATGAINGLTDAQRDLQKRAKCLKNEANKIEGGNK
jgi:hypothetical protein